MITTTTNDQTWPRAWKAPGTGAPRNIRDLTKDADIVVLLPDPVSARSCLELANDAADAVEDSIAAVHICADPLAMLTSAEEIELQMLKDLEEGSPDERFERVKQLFDEWKRGAPHRQNLTLGDCQGDLRRCLGTICQSASLVVTPYRGNIDARDTFHNVLFHEGKLVLVPPANGYRGHLLDHVLIGWKPHDHARRAMVAARPWLTAAKRITVLCVDDKPNRHYETTAREICHQLGLDAEIVVTSSTGRSVGNTILDFGISVNATCLLIGAFKHGYLLELLLGRVTYRLLSHATVPLLMCH
ncbi:universal stress protein [Rhizobium cauense]|uniref:universal stress protein n=1 Tax=Rhizobium cauense TaxID=1166683 RepID=UPI001C6F3F07|nr:universal stress protein [Rhizobium cauense]MBW9117580.1 universal stress protein [Rhizobium cauense]